MRLRPDELRRLAADIARINGTGGGGGPTDLGYSAAARLLTSSTGADVTLPLAGADAGLTSAADKTKLDGVATGATANATDAALRDRATHTGTQAAATITGLAAVATSGSAADLGSGLLPAARFDDTAHGSRGGGALHPAATTSVAGFMSGADKTKLDGIASGAQVNVPTDLAYTASTRLLASSTGADVNLPLVTSTDAGLAPASGGGTTNFLRADLTWAAPPAGGSLALTDLTDVTVASAAQGQVLTRGATEFQNLTQPTFTLGPFYINDPATSATTQATLGYFNTATALSRATPDIRMDVAGRVVGLIIVSDVARTAGTATARVRIAGTGTAFNAGAVVLDATNTLSDSSFVSFGNGVAFTAGQTVGADVVTAAFTPITANFSIWLVVMLQF